MSRYHLVFVSEVKIGARRRELWAVIDIYTGSFVAGPGEKSQMQSALRRMEVKT